MGTVEVAGDGVALYYDAIILLVLTWVVFSMRVGVRIWRKAFGMDDSLMLIGIVRVHCMHEAALELANTTSRPSFQSQPDCASPAATTAPGNSPVIWSLQRYRKEPKYVLSTPRR